MEIRPERETDAEGVRRVIVAAFVPEADGGHGEDVAAIWAGLGRHRRAGIVAVDGDEVVGHVGLSRAWLDARRELVDIWVLSPLSVAPERQGTGIGTRLVAAAVEAARASGTPMLVLEGSPRYYGARGFARADRLGVEHPSPRCPPPAFQVAVLDTREEWMTGRLVYPEIWWEHDAVGLRDPGLAEVEERFADS